MGTLYIISVPIGNDRDIAMNAIEKLQQADLIIGEEFKETSKLLKLNGIDREFELLNEHSDDVEMQRLLDLMLSKNLTCLISDAGTPGIEDPGSGLVNLAVRNGMEVKIVPGPSAITCALALCGFRISPFTFIGFLNREDEKRRLEIIKYLGYGHTLVLYETPYRYKKVIREIAKYAKKNYRIFLGLNLTAEDEIQYRGTLKEILPHLEGFPKSPPVIVIEC
ncbi:MAG TPA: SAM-dependent methyltransferase [Leptospiraceae bacterium]|nr:SAM-dependent methyltransferase [Leptospiraceae bacterium]HMW07312.1 SAM-dependent methyltransferase [Leptospiraceae bacterium]HMX34046.1 SAM-dependent methyltransferase [Leptospiraceae bacterium]HMY32980.1 SAM-dependent methyltransferase [Leptospiraceae bacterium]HNA08168.1 SAM-dependent methyltransferase [Leptospiraceae bacterium]